MSSDEPKRNGITRSLGLAYEDVTAKSIPDRFQELLRRMDEGGDDDLDPGIGAEPPHRPKGGPRSSGEIVALDGEDT